MISRKNNFNIKITLGLFFVFLLLQIIFWAKTENIKPNLGIVPEVPTLATMKAFALGDEEFYFRKAGFRLQNSGDTFGRSTALRKYNYEKLTQWFYFLDELDNKSNYIPSLAAYYFSFNQNEKETIYIIDYLVSHANRNPQKKWWWYYQAMFLADHVYGDKDLAIEIARKLRDSSPDTAPIWTKQMVAIFLANKGEDCESYYIMSQILEDYQNKENDLNDKELNYMKFFIEKRLDELKKKNFNPIDCYSNV